MTDEQIAKVAAALEADEEAKRAHVWLWNQADSPATRKRFFEIMVRAVVRAIEAAP